VSRKVTKGIRPQKPRRSVTRVKQGIRCSFCGKPEAEVGRLISGGGEQPLGKLPVVRICNECIALCNRILLDHPSPRQTRWTLFIIRGEQFEWAAFAQADGTTFMMVRRFGNDQKSFGLALEPGDQPSTDLARETVLKVPAYF